jgi:hypothetical protein
MEYQPMAPTEFKRKSRYTSNDLADMLIELHNCVHMGAEETRQVRQDLRNHRQEVAGAIERVNNRIGQVEGRQEERAKTHAAVEKKQEDLAASLSRVEARLGTAPDAPVKKAWFPSPWQLITGGLGCIAGLIILARLIIMVAPHLVDAIMKVGI